MKIEYSYWNQHKIEDKREIVGITLIAETDRDVKIIDRFHSGGMKENGTDSLRSFITISFADLIGKDPSEVKGE